MKKIVFYVSILFLAASCSKPRGCNVLLISIDSLRADHLGCYGYGRDTSPHLDRLAREGCLFENTVSTTSWTLPAHAALFTGLCDTAHGVILDGYRLDDKRITLAEILRDEGWKTAGFYSGPYLDPAFHLSQGFSRYQSCMERTREFDIHDLREILRAQADSHTQLTSPLVSQAALSWIDAHRQEPFFLFLHYFDVHHDYTPPPPYDTMFDPGYKGTLTGKGFLRNKAIHPGMDPADLNHLISLYDGEIAFTDHSIGKVLDKLRSLGILDKTVVAVTSDHGDEFFEHGEKGHRNGIYDEVLKIPLLVRFPPKAAGGKRISSQARIIDIAPTILDLLGIPPCPEAMGASLVPAIMGTAGEEEHPAISELHTGLGDTLYAVRTGKLKILVDEKRKRGSIYDLERDPGEKNPLPEDHPLKRKALQLYKSEMKALRKRARSLPKSETPQKALLSPQTEEELKRLGYLLR